MHDENEIELWQAYLDSQDQVLAKIEDVCASNVSRRRAVPESEQELVDQLGVDVTDELAKLIGVSMPESALPASLGERAQRVHERQVEAQKRLTKELQSVASSLDELRVRAQKRHRDPIFLDTMG